MSVRDDYRPAPGRAVGSAGLRWLGAAIWWVEHAFERAKADERPEEDTRVRIFIILAAFVLMFTCIAVAATHRALFANVGGVGFAGQSGGLQRADVVDRNGQLLATNIIHYGLYVDPAEVWDRDQAVVQLKRALPRISVRKLRNILAGDRRKVVLNGLTPQERMAVHALALGGVSFEPEDQRVYPLTPSARHVLGGVDTGGEGLSGLEKAFNAEIQAAGARNLPFETSIDLRVQGVVENELAAAAMETGAKRGIAIVTNVNTGEVLALASWPGTSSLNAATSVTYEMGSVFKTFAVAAGLDTGRADMDTLFDASQAMQIGKRRITDFHAQNRVMTLEEVYLHSSNIGTSMLAVGMGASVMRGYFQRLGLLEKVPFELPTETPIAPREWSDSTLASLSFGYGISITPAHMAAAMNALTNGGLYRPLTLRKGGLPGVAPRRVVSEQTSLTLLDLMRRNVVRGSGTRADAPGLRVGGKTGSANKSVNGRYSTAHAVGTFAGVFPADGPANAQRYGVLVLIDEPQTYPRTGGFVAAPAVGRIADRIAPFVGVERRDDPYRTALGEKIEPVEDVEGDGR